MDQQPPRPPPRNWGNARLRPDVADEGEPEQESQNAELESDDMEDTDDDDEANQHLIHQLEAADLIVPQEDPLALYLGLLQLSPAHLSPQQRHIWWDLTRLQARLANRRAFHHLVIGFLVMGVLDLCLLPPPISSLDGIIYANYRALFAAYLACVAEFFIIGLFIYAIRHIYPEIWSIRVDLFLGTLLIIFWYAYLCFYLALAGFNIPLRAPFLDCNLLLPQVFTHLFHFVLRLFSAMAILLIFICVKISVIFWAIPFVFNVNLIEYLFGFRIF